jgi:N-acetylglucosamine-6-phosphate deacetylase
MSIAIERGRIVDVHQSARKDPRSIECDGAIVPGFIDLHVHGGAGADFMDGTADAVRTVTAFHARHGTAALAATTLSASFADVATALGAIGEARREPRADAAEIAAVHFEGPYLSAARAGAQDPASVRTPDLLEVDSWLAALPGMRWMMTIAPEVDGAHAVFERFHREMVLSIGHTNCTYAETVDAIARGARHATHLFNAMPPLHHREPGPVAAAMLSSWMTGEIIADGMHVHPSVLRMAFDLMPNRLALVTDAMRACGMPEGTYKLYAHEVTVRDGAARLADGTLAGSILTMRGAVQNMVELAAVPIEAVIPLATEIPARIIGIDNRKGRIAPGMDADLLVLSPKFELTAIYARGTEVPPA